MEQKKESKQHEAKPPVGRMRYILLKKAFVDYECRDFHLTPVLTLSWPNTKELTNVKGGLVIAIEWGFWAAYIGCAALLVNPHPAEPGIR